MKTTFLIALTILALLACRQTTNTTTSDVPSDSAAVADVVHGFFGWYAAFAQDTTKRIDFTDDRGEHLTLNEPNLKRYFAHFTASGFVSNEFIEGEYAFYRACSRQWQQEPIDEVPSCLDADKYFCAQDWEPAFWTQSPVRIKATGPGRVLATLYGTYYGNRMERNVALKQENGKWVITAIECDMGLNPAATTLKTVTLDEPYVTKRMASIPALTAATFARLNLSNIVSEEKRQAPDTKICVLDTLLANDRGRVLLIARDSQNEVEAWMVQYDNANRVLYWEPVYYADVVEYIKTINTSITGNTVVVKTTTDADGNASVKTQKYILTDQLIFERSN